MGSVKDYRDGLKDWLNKPVEFVPGTRFPLICPHCQERRKRLDDIKLIACGCISSHWIRLHSSDFLDQQLKETPHG